MRMIYDASEGRVPLMTASGSCDSNPMRRLQKHFSRQQVHLQHSNDCSFFDSVTSSFADARSKQVYLVSLLGAFLSYVVR